MLSLKRFCRISQNIHTRTFSSALSASDVNFFRNEGYLAVNNFFDEDEFRAIRAGLVKLNNMGRLANVATAGDGVTHSKQVQNLQLCPLSPELPLFKSLPFNNKVTAALSQLLFDASIETRNNESIEDQNICCYLSQTFWKPAQYGAATGWHQDNAYFLFSKPQFSTALWIPIHKSTKQTGTIKVVRGFTVPKDMENGTPIKHIRSLYSDHHVSCEEIIEEHHSNDIVDLEVDEGGVAFFNGNVPHMTASNVADTPRAAVAYHFVNYNHFIERQFPLPEDSEYITPIVSGKDCTDGEKEYGFKIGNNQWLTDMDNILKEEQQIMDAYDETHDWDGREVKQDSYMPS